ncbi:alcohol dehydrogenase-like 7 [Andrographis paniculata]|uniref:alcohol dehydrogenase-like 7 n=1 Tax=Andrographis paniculata TaxID=175694 RepID=UPI0021E73CCB|nr:alcohol dehydrogenase-like 7 [Andrographis paniculata]
MDAAKVESSGTAGKPIRCRAAVARKAGEPLVIEEVIVDTPKSEEVRIKVLCTSLCFSDVTFWRLKEPPACFPRILGHEAVGVVESIGEGVTGLVPGDTVIPIFVADCEDCTDCLSKKSNLCSKYPFHVSSSMPDGTSRFKDLKGESIYHFLSVSSFTEYTVVHLANVTKIDPVIPPDRACLLSCGVSTGVGAAWRSAQVEAGSTVVIIGLGSIGLAVAEGARFCGAARIIGVDMNPDKAETSKKFGVTEYINPQSLGDKRLSEVIKEMTGGGADYCFECVGKASLVEEAFAASRKGWGKTVVLGVDKPGAQLTFGSFDVLHLGKSIMGSLFGGLKPKSDIPILIQRYLDKELELEKFVTHEVSFGDINKAFELLLEGQSLRCVIWTDK